MQDRPKDVWIPKNKNDKEYSFLSQDQMKSNRSCESMDQIHQSTWGGGENMQGTRMEKNINIY